MKKKHKMVSNDTSNEVARIESKLEVSNYLKNLRYALEHGATITFQEERLSDKRRKEKYTNAYTVATLFPEESPIGALKRELSALTVEEYMRTVKDVRYPERSEMREFGKVYGDEDVYIKIRVELLSADGMHTTFVMSFHFAMKPFSEDSFPYKHLSRGDNNEEQDH